MLAPDEKGLYGLHGVYERRTIETSKKYRFGVNVFNNIMM